MVYTTEPPGFSDKKSEILIFITTTCEDVFYFTQKPYTDTKSILITNLCARDSFPYQNFNAIFNDLIFQSKTHKDTYVPTPDTVQVGLGLFFLIQYFIANNIVFPE